jgi:flagellar hook-associated protein 1 FlgK
LTGFTSLSSLASVDDVNMPIGVASLDLPVRNGGFIIQVFDARTGVTIDHYIEIRVYEPTAHNPFSLKTPPAPGGTTFQDLADAINAIDGLVASINTLGELEIRSEGGNVEFAFAQDTSGVLSALGLNTFFTGVRAGTIGVNPTLMSDPSKFAASQSGVGGDTAIGVSLAALAITPNSALGGATLINRYNGIVSETMMAGATMKAITAANMLYHESLQAQRDSISGVNVDEETTMLMIHQRMFQANSRFMSIVDQMMSMLLSI